MEQIELIQSKTYKIRGQKVMIDRDLAEMYEVETSNSNELSGSILNTLKMSTLCLK